MLRQELFDRVDILRKDSPAERIRNMRDLLEEAGDEAQKIRHLPDWAAKEMANAGLYRFALPTELAGEDLLARDQIEAVEAASAIDGSVGWCVQINSEIKKELHDKLDEFATHNDSLEEIFENKEQIEISKFYERLPNPAIIAFNEYMNGELEFRKRDKE